MLDGKYEITSERELDFRTTLFAATAPDGTALQISWYDLGNADEERAFESYRSLLRQLQRRGHAGVYDLVARPGAYYVAWRLPDTAAASAGDLSSIDELLQTHGRTLNEAHLGREGNSTTKIYGLPFRSTPSVPSAATGSPPELRPNAPQGVDNLWITSWTTMGKTLWKTLWSAFRPWAPGTVLALIGVLLLLLSVQRTLQTRLVNVPEVRGQEIGAALSTLYRTGFSTEAVALASARPTGTVIEVSPEVGTPLRPGRTVSVSYALSAGRAPEAVPAVIGQALAEAETRLSEAGFKPGEIAHIAHRAAAGTVIAQTPAARAQAPRGARIGLLVSDGPQQLQTFLPDLTGLSLNDALTLAEEAGFAREAVKLESTPGSGAAADTVLAQNITPFFSVPLGARLRLNIAQSSVATPGENGTPDLIGLDLTEAQVQARSAGVSVVQTESVSTPLLPLGVVLQRPAPGTPLRNTVEVTVNTRAAGSTTGGVRRAEYRWLLEPGNEGRQATVTVTDAAGQTQVVLRGQRVRERELAGVYLTTASGPLTFRLELDGEGYDRPLTVDP